MTETNVFQLSQPGTFADPLTDVLRNGARALLAHAVQAEAAAWLSAHADKLTDDGRQRLVRHGYLPEREIMTGIGAVPVRCPRVRDRAGEGAGRASSATPPRPPARSRRHRRRPRARVPSQAPPFEVEEERFPRLRALAHAVDEPDKFLFAAPMITSRHCAASSSRGLHMDAVDPEVNVAFGREIALAYARPTRPP